ncbi:glycosyltransferase family 25 protein, partial [Paraburkholderia fungorum]|uniref:glycosyltransferase family 25 protein n=1 Tax=Paraburkholderia fungorum TaxID=134537 RepID=UPI000DB322F3
HRYGRAMTPAEVACFMSHRSVWRTIADTGHAAVICWGIDRILDTECSVMISQYLGDRLATARTQ